MPELSFEKHKPHPWKHRSVADLRGVSASLPPPPAPPSSAVRYAELAVTSNFTFLTGASHPDEMDVVGMWAALGRAVGRSVLVVPIPKPIIRAAGWVATAAASVVPFHNQLDDKQVRQITAPAFVCSGARLQRELGWAPARGLDEALADAAVGYRASSNTSIIRWAAQCTRSPAPPRGAAIARDTSLNHARSSGEIARRGPLPRPFPRLGLTSGHIFEMRLFSW